MAGSRKPNPKHITRYERESFSTLRTRGEKPFRFSHYDHGIKVPGEYVDEVRRKGFVRVEETNAEHWGRVLDEHDEQSLYGWSTEHRRHVERMAGDAGLANVQTWTVGHIVWPGKEDEVCRECPYGGGSR